LLKSLILTAVFAKDIKENKSNFNRHTTIGCPKKITKTTI